MDDKECAREGAFFEYRYYSAISLGYVSTEGRSYFANELKKGRPEG
jgi:hypothetical protein